MANQKLEYHSSVYYPLSIGCCPQVYICLNAEGAALTLSGNSLILAEVQNSGRYLGGGSPVNTENVRCNDVYQYSLVYDDAQLLEGQTISCDQILELFPYSCTAESILSPAMLCLEPRTTLPDATLFKFCTVALEGHATLPDGLYTSNGTDWVETFSA